MLLHVAYLSADSAASVLADVATSRMVTSRTTSSSRARTRGPLHRVHDIEDDEDLDLVLHFEDHVLDPRSLLDGVHNLTAKSEKRPLPLLIRDAILRLAVTGCGLRPQSSSIYRCAVASCNKETETGCL